ncbi:MAG: hypothetical protein QSU88_10735, partial [Candidatus Methanoperedens sp.]|nr:hypothetical protein [Candidatus Methanoperedens sp.]
IAPFLEHGVGFNPELTAEDNVRLYGAIMGMSKKEMEDKFEEIFKFKDHEKSFKIDFESKIQFFCAH